MKLRHALLSLAIAACASTPALARQAPAKETADQFVARINAELKAMYPEITVPQWLAATYISDDTQMLAAAKKAVPDTVIVANTGCRPETIARQLSVADAAVVGTTFKVNGVFENEVDVSRVKTFMAKVHEFRG